MSAADIEAQFTKFQAALGALREIRSVRNIPPKADIEFVARCDRDTVALLQPMEPYFASMARATCRGWGAEVEVPQPNATGVLPGIELYVDLKDFINVDEERERLGKERDKHLGFIKSKEAKLGNESFVSRAPADVVQRERDQLEQLREQLAAIDEALAALSK